MSLLLLHKLPTNKLPQLRPFPALKNFFSFKIALTKAGPCQDTLKQKKKLIKTSTVVTWEQTESYVKIFRWQKRLTRAG